MFGLQRLLTLIACVVTVAEPQGRGCSRKYDDDKEALVVTVVKKERKKSRKEEKEE